MKGLHAVTFILLVVGGLNWLGVAFGFNVVDKLGSSLAMIIYVLVGVSAVVQVLTHKGYCRYCDKGMGQSM